MRRTYSPGASNVALVVTLPVSLSIFGFDGSIFTAAGPRNRLHLTDGGGGLKPGIGGIGLTFGPSSLTHASSVSGLPAVVVSDAAMAEGGPVTGLPLGSNLIAGGVFLLAASSNGSTMYSGFVWSVMLLVKPLATSVHVSFLSPKSFGSLIVKTPHWRPLWKCVGCP